MSCLTGSGVSDIGVGGLSITATAVSLDASFLSERPESVADGLDWCAGLVGQCGGGLRPGAKLAQYLLLERALGGGGLSGRGGRFRTSGTELAGESDGVIKKLWRFEASFVECLEHFGDAGGKTFDNTTAIGKSGVLADL